MSEAELHLSADLTVRSNQPLIGVFADEDGQEVVRYFVDEATADQALSQDTIQAALGLAGAWSDLDWDEAIEELDRTRHESRPTPPISNL